MPTWYWVLFTIITIVKPLFIEPIKFQVYKDVYDKTHK